MPTRLVDLGATTNLVVVSDIHMRTPDDPRALLFCSFLDQLENCDTLVLLGDIFDFINARQSFYYQLWSDVFSRLNAVRSRGVKVVFVEGNHDFGFEHGTCHEVAECFDVRGDIVVRVKHQSFGNMLLMHSDDIVCPPSYRLFRNVVKSNVFQSLVNPVPGKATSYLFSRYAELSRSKDEYRLLSSEFLTACVDDFLNLKANSIVEELRMCVFGHIHVHLDDHRGAVRFVSGPDWFSAPNTMSFTSDGQLKRSWLRPSGIIPKRFCFTPVGEIAHTGHS